MLKESWGAAAEEVVLRGYNIQLSVLGAAHSLPEPWARRPATPRRPAVGEVAAAAEVCSEPCASPRQTGVGTHAPVPGLQAPAAVRRRLRKKGSRAVCARSGWG